LFKSYYVVWKLKYINKKNDINKKFKSYYVVWKQFYFEHIVFWKFRFKSYYVVWKLQNFLGVPFIVSSLNRTM